jgi:quinol-cytochrome oxidoreductase complex cytochrome b subunit
MTERDDLPPPAEPKGVIEWFERRLDLSELFSFLSHFGLVYTPLDTRLPFRELLRLVARRPVSSYLSWPRVLGLVTTVLFGVLAVTGVLLACYYQPTPEAAYASTRGIARDVPLGWWVRQVHAWGAWLLLAAVVARLVRFFLEGLYRAPREILWWSMVGMGWITVQLDFTGRLLPWTQSGYWSVTRGLEAVAGLPIVGPVLTFVGGGAVVNEVVLLRFYVLHTMVLPAVFMACFFLTFATLRRVGLSTVPHTGGFSTGRDHFFRVALLFVLVVGVLTTLAVAIPLPFLREADPVVTPRGVTAPWYLIVPALVRDRLPLLWLPVSGLFVLSTLVAFFLPLLLRGGDERRAALLRSAGLALGIAWILLTAGGLFLERGR